MDKGLFFKVIILVIFVGSCSKDNLSYIVDDYILAGQNNSTGIEYIDFEPDIECTIINPWQKTDTTFNLDLNNDGINDFSINGMMCHPAMLGADCEKLTMVPLMNNELYIDPTSSWLDTIPYLDTISYYNDWTNKEALIYYYYWQINQGFSESGYWKDVTAAGQYFIGYRIFKDEKIFYGWMNMRKDTTFRPFRFLLTDYAILKPYREQ